jgi:hypothetical protein
MNINGKGTYLTKLAIILLIPYYIVWALGYLNVISMSLYRTIEYPLSAMYIVGIALVIWYGVKSFMREVPRRYAGITLAIIAVFVALSFSLSYIKYLTYNATAWDLGIYMQNIYTTAYYHMMFYYTVEPPPSSFFRTHVSPILFFISADLLLVPARSHPTPNPITSNRRSSPNPIHDKQITP